LSHLRKALCTQDGRLLQPQARDVRTVAATAVVEIAAQKALATIQVISMVRLVISRHELRTQAHQDFFAMTGAGCGLPTAPGPTDIDIDTI